MWQQWLTMFFHILQQVKLCFTECLGVIFLADIVQPVLQKSDIQVMKHAELIRMP